MIKLLTSFKINFTFKNNVFLSVLLKLILLIDVRISFNFCEKQKGISVQEILKEITLFRVRRLEEVDAVLARFHLIPLHYQGMFLEHQELFKV